MIKGNQRTNGLLSPLMYSNPPLQSKSSSNYLRSKSLVDHHEFLSDSDLSNVHSYSSEALSILDDACNNKLFHYSVKNEPQEQEFENKTNLHSIIGLGNEDFNSHKLNSSVKPRVRRNSLRSTHHESLQRIDPSYEHFNHYQQHWFSAGLERLQFEDKSREERLEITRYELRRQLKQLLKCNVGHVAKSPDHASADEKFTDEAGTNSSGYDRLVAPRNCDFASCTKQALPCTRYCTRHIMHNTEQVLFHYCTAKFSDNTQCSVPVFDLSNDLPLCPEHARKKDNYQLIQEMKPKKLRKKVKPSAMIRPQKRNKKKKRPSSSSGTSKPSVSEGVVSSPHTTIEHSQIRDIATDHSPILEEEMVEQVLSLQEPDLELVNVDQALAHQATHLLEESDITNVLSTIQADEFSDFFTVNRNGDYEPTTEETEELERALAAVDNDVKSLEKLSQSQGLLDSLLDEHTLVESLVQIPDMFHNGYTPCGDSMVVGQTSRLLPVEPHSHS